MKTLDEILKYYVKKIINNPGYVVEVGHSNIVGGVRKYFEANEDYCLVDNKRVTQVDIISEYSYLTKLFDYQPYIIISMDLFNTHRNIKKLIKETRELLMPGGYFVVLLDIKNKDTLKYLFERYKTKDVSVVSVGQKTMICGIARKPYRIAYDIKDNP
jgi:hypothetical protein